MKNSITDVPGIEVGHAQNMNALTGVSVLLCRKGAVGGVDQRGGAPGTKETDLLNPVNMIEKIHAICLCGGSAFGLDAASGVMKYLEERKIGYNVGVTFVPIVPAAVIFDLSLGDPMVRPDAAMGYEAATNASVDETRMGNIGVGTGASIGKLFGNQGAMKGGVGTASMEIGGGIIVGALVAVNAFGDVIDPSSGNILAGTRSVGVGPVHLGSDGYYADTLATLKTFPGRFIANLATRSNTVIGVVATNAKFDKAGITKIAQMAHDGLARAIRPAHTMLDGDTIFAVSTGSKSADISTVGAFAAEVFQAACVNAVMNAESAGGLPGLKKPAN
jgi:L-aminopeptidase/D-esterase-like protein